MNKLIFVLAFASCCFAAEAPKKTEVARWEREARNVTIIGDDWGIAHVFGKTDADTVFGAMYVQASAPKTTYR